MPRDSLYRYECGICTTAVFARGLPLNWIGTHVGPLQDEEDLIYLCPKHADVLIEQVPRTLLHPQFHLERGSFQQETATDTSTSKSGIMESVAEAFATKRKVSPP
jgi:hypothetical protein